MTDFQIPANYFSLLLNKLDSLEKNAELNKQIDNHSAAMLTTIKDLILNEQTLVHQRKHKNPLNFYGQKCFSQSDEDGITLEIVRRLGLQGGVYAEFGVGNGLENNTLILAALGWSGFWVGGEQLAFDNWNARRFHYIRDWITIENVVSHAASGLAAIGASEIDIASLDLDGNDYHFVGELLGHGFRPKLFIVEYNAKFPPPVQFAMRYDAAHCWAGDDYFGASLSSFAALFSAHGYKLVCCNSHTGANAFFVRSEYGALFLDIPESIGEIYVSPRYHLYNSYGHRPSVKLIAEIMQR